uniref:Uncharacterized protein n=1 Tax=Anguilla anguilla TaxID=7936 RepID=A0A0E9PKM6_ANGAN
MQMQWKIKSSIGRDWVLLFPTSFVLAWFPISELIRCDYSNANIRF